MAKMVEGFEALNRKLKALRDKMPEAIQAVLIECGEELAADARTLAEASRRTGELIESIHVTGPGQTTPPHSTDGGQRTAGPFEVLVTAGSTDARHAHLVEGGTVERQHEDGTSTGTMAAKPFFNPAWRLNKRKAEQRIQRVARKVFREAVRD